MILTHVFFFKISLDFFALTSKKSKLQCKMMTASDGERMCHLKYMVTPDWPCYPFRDDTGKCYPLGAADEHIGRVLNIFGILLNIFCFLSTVLIFLNTIKM